MTTNNSCNYRPTQYSVLSGGANGNINNISPSTSGFVLTSNGASAQPSFQALSVGITSVAGDSGSITGSSITIFSNNSALNCGSSVLFTNTGTTSTLNVTDASGNTMIGLGAGVLVNTAATCTGLGSYALSAITDDTDQVAIGYAALGAANDGEGNVAAGSYALGSLVAGGQNVACGNRAALSLVSGNYNAFFGYFSGTAYTGSESNNVIIAHPGVVGESNVMRLGTTGSSNLEVNKTYIGGVVGATQPASGNRLLTINTSTEQVTLVPDGTNGQFLQTNGSGTLSWQTVSSGGISTINGNTGSVTGSTVTIRAYPSGGTARFISAGTISTLRPSDAYTNTGWGDNSLISNTSGSYNCAYGAFSLSTNTTGTFNCAYGQEALASNTSGLYNIGVGYQALYSCTANSNNIGIGYQALYNSTVGNYNIAIGSLAGTNYYNPEANNIVIGNTGVMGDFNVIRIGTQGSSGGQQNACYIAGIHGVTVTGSAVLCSSSGQLGDISSSREFKENIVDISESILSMRPVQFNYKSDKDKNVCYGMIAEEAELTFKSLVLYKDGRPYSIKYHEMPALLLKEIQRLVARIEQLESKVLK